MSNIIATLEENFGIITLNNARVHNALKKSEIKIIRQAFLEWKDLKLDAILITGTGESFSSGLFLDEFDKKSWDRNPITLICEDIENCRCPVICALNGGAYGGAVEIALSCDFRVADKDVLLAVPAASLGIHYEPSGIRRTINILGPSITRRLFLLGEVIYFDDILRTQFIDFWVVEGESVIERSKKLVKSLRNNGPLAIEGMKKTIIEILNDSLNTDNAQKRIEKCFNSEEHKEGLLAKIQKRRPNYRGF